MHSNINSRNSQPPESANVLWPHQIASEQTYFANLPHFVRLLLYIHPSHSCSLVCKMECRIECILAMNYQCIPIRCPPLLLAGQPLLAVCSQELKVNDLNRYASIDAPSECSMGHLDQTMCSTRILFHWPFMLISKLNLKLNSALENALHLHTKSAAMLVLEPCLASFMPFSLNHNQQSDMIYGALP